MFKESFKYYKSKSQTPSYEKVVDFEKIDENVNKNLPAITIIRK